MEGFSTCFSLLSSVGAVFGVKVKGRHGGIVELERKEWRLGNDGGWDG